MLQIPWKRKSQSPLAENIELSDSIILNDKMAAAYRFVLEGHRQKIIHEELITPAAWNVSQRPAE
jgi:hypothetical protein